MRKSASSEVLENPTVFDLTAVLLHMKNRALHVFRVASSISTVFMVFISTERGFCLALRTII
jgi:hypothetical protein